MSAVVLLLAALSLGAQPYSRRAPSGAIARSSLVGIVHAYPRAGADSSICIVGYQLNAGDLVFFQRRQSPPTYVALFVVTVEMRDTIGVVRYATVFRDSVVLDQPPPPTVRAPVANVEIATLANGQYTVSIDVSQQQQQRLVWHSTITLGPSPQSVAAASLMFLDQADRGDTACAQLWGQTIPFGTRRSAALLVVPRQWSGRDKLVAACRLREQYFPFYRGDDTVATILVTIDPRAIFAVPVWSVQSGGALRTLCMHQLLTEQHRLVLMELDLRRAIPGDYELLLIRPATSDTLEIPFRVQWFAPPPHLFVSRYAVEVMRYVLTDQEYTALLDTPDSNRTAAIIRWWTQHDPTPATRYNEAMVEYFRRAFAARTKLATAQEPDGALSERGKVFILFGEPSRIETSLEPDKPGVEVWQYTNAVRKRFTFEVTDQGRYRLVKVDAL